MTRTKQKSPPQPVVRCAVYTRVSTAEQAEGDYSSLDAQRETGEAYVASQKHAGWQCLPDRYDDGGYTGANVERPAFQRLMADIRSGKVNCVACYKLDRLTRSLIDFARTLEIFEQHKVALVSVTQAFDTSTATGKLMMHILMSFAEFERQLISERTRDKIAAARRKGKWSGGMSVLGYDVVATKLVVNPVEADKVRELFRLYLDHRSLTTVVAEIDRRGWRTKEWVTQKGLPRGGRPFDKTSLYKVHTNPVYIGKVRHKSDLHVGEHVPIVDREVFESAQRRLTRNGSTGGKDVRNKYGALLNGLVRCGHCQCAMAHHYTSRGNRRYRYYVCTTAQKRGWKRCPAPSVPAGELERFVVGQIRDIGRDPALVLETVAAVGRQVASQSKAVGRERDALRRKLAAHERKLTQLASADLPEDLRRSSVADVQQQISRLQCRLSDVERELAVLATQTIPPIAIATALAEFDVVWGALEPCEQADIIRLLVKSVVWDAASESVTVTLHDAGLRPLAADREENAA